MMQEGRKGEDRFRSIPPPETIMASAMGGWRSLRQTSRPAPHGAMMHDAPARERRPRLFVGIALMAVAPFLLLTGYFFAGRAGGWHSNQTDTISWGVSVAVGCAGLAIIPVGRILRVALAIPYVGLLSVGLFIYSAPIVCGFFGDCL